MSQCVPSWNHPSPPSKLTVCPLSSSISNAPDVPIFDYEVAELIWENGQLAMHSLGPPRVPTKYTWDKPRAGGTLESIVNQAAVLPHRKSDVDGPDPGIYAVNEFVPWFDHHHATATVGGGRSCGATTSNASASATMTMDALVPCSNNNNNRNEDQPSSHVMESEVGTCGVDCSARVGSCSVAAGCEGGRVARGGHEWSSGRDQSVSGSATFGRDSRQVTLDTCEIELGVGGFTSTSMGSPGNTSSGKQCTKTITGDDHDSVCHSKPQRGACDDGDNKKVKGKYSVSTKRSRAAAIHNQSERKRRDKINQRMKTLQKLVPNSSKTDKASMLDEVIEYLKQLQAQIHMMSRMNMSPAAMMLPMALQQLQMPMMAPMMGMGMGMGHVMDLNSMTRPGLPSVLHPSAAAFMPMPSWDGSVPAPSSVLPDPLSTFLACQSQPMTMDAYSRMAALYQQMHQAPGPTPKN